MTQVSSLARPVPAPAHSVPSHAWEAYQHLKTHHGWTDLGGGVKGASGLIRSSVPGFLEVPPILNYCFREGGNLFVCKLGGRVNVLAVLCLPSVQHKPGLGHECIMCVQALWQASWPCPWWVGLGLGFGLNRVRLYEYAIWCASQL